MLCGAWRPSMARVMDITVCRPSDGRHSLDRRLAALMDINNAPQPAANRGTENDRLLHQNYSPDRFGAGVRRLFLRAVVELKLCLQRRGAADVYQRRVPPLQLRDPEHSADHRLHDQGAGATEQRLPCRDGPRSQGSQEGRRSIICTLRRSSERLRVSAAVDAPATMVQDA